MYGTWKENPTMRNNNNNIRSGSQPLIMSITEQQQQQLELLPTPVQNHHHEETPVLLDAAGSQAPDDLEGGRPMSAPFTSMPVRPSSRRALYNQPRSWKEYLSSADFLELLACLVFYIVCSSLPDWMIRTHERPIPYQYLANSGDYVRSSTNSESNNGETVSDTLLIFLSVILPLTLQLLSARFWGRGGDVHATLCVFLVALGLTFMCTDAVKKYVGYLRPIFYSVCQPNDNYSACTTAHSDSVRKSFPSGHASWSFCGLTLLSTYWHRRFGLPSILAVPGPLDAASCSYYRDGIQHPSLYRLRSIMALIPMGVALWVAASRVLDNKHFPADVVGGSVLGASLAVFVSHLWMPW